MDEMVELLDYKIIVVNIADDGVPVIVDGVVPDDIIDKKNFCDEFVKFVCSKQDIITYLLYRKLFCQQVDV